MSWSIFLASFGAFGGLLHQGRIIGHWQDSGGCNFTWGFNIWRSISWHFGPRLQEGILLTPIYHSTGFGVIWSLPSARPKYWVFLALHEDVPSTGRVWTWPWSFLYWSSSCIQPLEACIFLSGAFCSSSYLIYWIHLMLFQIYILIVSGSCLLYE